MSAPSTRALRILMVAPQPFLRPRGTPFSVLHRTRALIRLGHRVELVTYPFGEAVELEGLRLVRAARVPGIRDVPIGPSVAKALSDVPLFTRAYRMARRGGYGLVHTHEEAGAFGAFLRRRLGIPHLYDMHSSLPQQLENFDRYRRRPFVRGFERLERYILDGSDGVIAICDALGEQARAVGYTGPLGVIENTLDDPPPGDVERRAAALGRELGLDPDVPVVAYTGSLERYQGLDLLLDAAAGIARDGPPTRFLIVGGTPEQSEALRRDARARGAGEAVLAVPAVAPEEVHAVHRLADLLVTPRSRGTNTPLKVYQYLRAGRPIVATDIRAHTQALDARAAELVPPDPEGIAAGIRRLLADRERCRSLARGAQALAHGRFGADEYHRRLRAIVAATLGDAMPVGAGER